MDLKSLQDEEYKALKYLSHICEVNNLKLFLRGGSVLGSVKYKNFVPWDDDIDVALPRKDYEKLIKLIPESIDDRLLFISYQKSAKAHCYFPRVILSDKARTEMGFPKNNERGLVLIDILPLDGMPNSALSIKMHIFKAYFYRVLASLWTLEASDTVSMHGGKKDKVLKFLYKLRIHKLYKQDTIYKRLDKLYSKYEFGKTANCGMLSSSKLKKEIVPFSWWDNGTVGQFRELNVLLPKEYDNYLKRLFGDNYFSYEPQESERKKSHLTGIE